MKKVMSFILAAILSLSVIPQGLAQAEITDDLYKERVVTGLSIVDSKLKEKEYITRADFVLTLAALINETVRTGTKSSFDDVTVNTKECGAIELLKGMGLVVGTGENKFSPDEPIVYSDAVRLILKATDNIIEFNSEEIVSEKNYDILTDGIANAVNGKITYATLVKLIYNALEVTVLPITFVEAGTVSGNIAGGETIPEYFFNLERVSGVLESDSYSSVKETAANYGYISIDGRSYKSYDDFNEFLGYNVDCFVDIDTHEVVFLTADDENEIIVIDETSIGSYTGRAYLYETDEGRTKREKLGYEIDIAYNDRAMMTYDEKKMIPENGYVILIDNNDDNDIDVVRVIDYKNIYVSGKSSDDEQVTIFDQESGLSAVLSESQGTETIVTTGDGSQKKISDVKSGNVVSVIGEETEDGIIAYRAIISTESVSGAVTGIDAEEGIVEIDDVSYYVSNSIDISSLSFNQEYTFSLDFRGKLAGTDGMSRDDLPMAIGYVTKAIVGDDGECYVKILTPYNKIIGYTCAEKVRVEGHGSEKDPEVLKNLFTSNSPVLAYTVDEEKRIDKVVFASDYTAGGPNSVPSEFGVYNIFKSGSSTYKYYSYFKSFFGKLTLKDSTIMFVVSEDDETGEATYKVEPITRLQNETPYEVDGYVYNNGSALCDIAVLHASVNPEASSEANVSVVKKIVTTLDEDDMPVQQVTLVGKQGEVELYTSEDSVLTSAKQYNNDAVTNLKVNIGDVVLYATDSDNKICNFVLVYDYDENILYSDSYIGDGNHESTGRRIMQAQVYNLEGGYVQLADVNENLARIAWDKIETLPMERVAVVVLEEEGGKRSVRLGGTSDIETYKANGRGARVIMNSRAYIGYVLVVIK
ncbi:MAG: S-layer homology domain-containing protein [Clostridia bacterium]|nr:S-layer homology domain-containing protein [Clostridia bacterium]